MSCHSSSLLDDRDRLDARYREVGDKRIARELGVSERQVREARARLGIRSLPPGRRRGTSHLTLRVTEENLAACICEASMARARGDDDAYDRCLIRLADTASVLVRERQRLRAA